MKLAILLIQAAACGAFVINSSKGGITTSLASSRQNEISERTTTTLTQADRNGLPSYFSTSASNPMTTANTGSYGGTYGAAMGPKKSQVPNNKSIGRNIWETTSAVTVQGNSLRTWSFATDAIRRVGVFLKTEGRPLNTNIELWQGPDNTPQKMSVYIEDGCMRPFSCVIETPGSQNTVAIRNTGQMEFPCFAAVEADVETTAGKSSAEFGTLFKEITKLQAPKTIQGGAVHTYPFNPSVASVQIMLKTDGRPMSARIELLQGPNNNKQVIEVYTEDGKERPFFAMIETPGSGNVVRIVNTATVEFPMTAIVAPYVTDDSFKSGEGDVVGNGYFILDRQW